MPKGQAGKDKAWVTSIALTCITRGIVIMAAVVEPYQYLE